MWKLLEPCSSSVEERSIVSSLFYLYLILEWRSCHPMPVLSRMEKAREVRRRGNRISVTDNRDSGLLERRGKEKVRSSSSSLLGEMGGGSGSEEEGERQRLVGGRIHRFKLNGKAFNERDAVDVAAVPRKLRSVTIKRNRESISSALLEAKKQRHVSMEETPQCDKVDRSKQHSKSGARGKSSKQLTAFSITRDEEEVAEALFALARMFPCDKISKKKADRKLSVAKSASITEIKSNSSLTLEAAKEDDTELPSCSSLGEGQANNITVKPDVSVKLEPTIDASFSKESHLSANGSFQLDLEKIPTSSIEDWDEGEEEAEFANVSIPVKASCNTYLSCMGASSDPYIEDRFLEQKPINVSSIQKTENGLCPVLFSDLMKEDAQTIKNNNLQIGVDVASFSNGLSGKSLNGYEFGSGSLMSNKSSLWSDSLNRFSNPLSNENNASKDKLDIRLLKVKKSRKKCATHVYITRLIQAYNGLERNNQDIPEPAYEMKANGQSISGSMTFKNEVVDFKNYLNNNILGPKRLTTERSSHEERKGQIQDKQHLADQLALNSFGLSLQQNQASDFLSLSPGWVSTKKNISERNNPESLVDSSLQAQLPHSQSCLRRHTDHVMLPPPARYCSGYPDLIPTSTLQQVQLQKYLASQHIGNVSGAASKQHQHSPQLQHWGQYRPPNVLPYPPKWQNGVHHDPFFELSGLHMTSLRPPSLDAFGVKFTPHHQQLFPNISSPSMGKKPTPTGNVDDNAADLRTDANLQQLLLNAQHS